MPAANQKLDGMLDSWGRRNRKIADKQCAECGRSFRPARDASRYCSRPCAWKNNAGRKMGLQVWWTNQQGYVEGRILTAQGQRRVKQHRFVMECALGRLLRPDEDVHHINGNKSDNRIENLEVLQHAEHSKISQIGRTYPKGYKLELSDAERHTRSLRLGNWRRAAIRLARGEK